ncbi:MAG TPA: TlyA family RNA methyltransferase [Oligoflexia bacterium]|nr:TlyA family RNA methyltransferase [Oligoflexia bacterium]HMP48859.1 TlyA family RNA methyltransferase [Oligoflexia bacterium]
MKGSKTRERLDVLVVSRGLVPTREKGRALILAGDVLVQNVPVTKCGTLVDLEAEIRIRSSTARFVSRGGDKLYGALTSFGISVGNLVCLDLGASTGGFTDCLLQEGASLVYAVDVGTNQLDYRIRTNPRVRVYEQTHASQMSGILFDPHPKFAVIDVSFIGLRKVLPYVVDVLCPEGSMVMLVKPQFELEPEMIGPRGVLRDPTDSALAIDRVRSIFPALKLKELSILPSVLKGKKSENQEFFIYACLYSD